MKLAVLGAIVLLNGSVLSVDRCPSNPRKRCSIKGTLARCNGMSYIPPLPTTVTTLNLECSLFRKLTRETFENISTQWITKLKITRNNFTSITGSALVNFVKLVTLEISHETGLSAESVSASLSNLNSTRISRFLLRSNGWTTLPDNFFGKFYTRKVTFISLDSNMFITFNTTLLKKLKTKFINFSCESCGIETINVSGLNPVQGLGLKDNTLFAIPNFCEENCSSFAPYLEILDVTSNALKVINPHSFDCLWNLKVLRLDWNPITVLKSYAFFDIPQLQVLSLSYISTIKNLNSAAFASNSLSSLRFIQNGFRFDRNQHYRPGHVFKELPNLTQIDLTKNFLPREDNRIMQLFSHLKNLKALRLGSTGLTQLPHGFLQSMPHLELIDLHGNKIEEWTTETFSNLKNLSILLLDGNLIRIINSASFPESLVKSITRIQLSENPFSCTCELKWFLDLLHTKNFTAKLRNWPHRYACGSPTERKYLLLSKYYPSTDECNPLRIFNIIIITVCSVFITMFLIILITIKCQINLRNITYFLRSWILLKRGYMQIPSGSDFIYHVFIVYCDADRHWVHNTLLKKLEIDGINVCVHHRDFTLGMPITENIIKCMDQSWKIMVILSNEFAKSEWCQWELDLVHERKRRSGNEALIVIMYKEVDSTHMIRSLRTLLMTSHFIIYKKGVGEKLFWTTVVKNITRPLNLPPISVL